MCVCEVACFEQPGYKTIADTKGPRSIQLHSPGYMIRKPVNCAKRGLSTVFTCVATHFEESCTRHISMLGTATPSIIKRSCGILISLIWNTPDVWGSDSVFISICGQGPMVWQQSLVFCREWHWQPKRQSQPTGQLKRVDRKEVLRIRTGLRRWR